MADRVWYFVDEAVDEMLEAADQYDKADDGLGDRFLVAVQAAIDTIVEAPHRWPQVHGPYRRYLVHRFPFCVYYRFGERHVEIVAVAHRRQRPNYWLGR